MFTRLSRTEGRPVSFLFEGRAMHALEGDSLAAALLASGVLRFRTTPASGGPRGPYCMMGVCFECLLVVDGRENVQACLTPVREGMRVSRQAGPRSVGP